MRSIIISSITGLTPPYEIYICDVYGNQCQYIDTITNNVPPIDVIPLPPLFSGAPSVGLKIIETIVPCEKLQLVTCTYLPNVYFTFCNCSDLSNCIYTEDNPNLNFGDVVSLDDYSQCWVYSGYQFTNDVALSLTYSGSVFTTCQECYNVVAPTYFSACCYDYTFTFDETFQNTFTPNSNWYVNISGSSLGSGTGYTGCTTVVANYSTPNQTYTSVDWDVTTNRETSNIFPYPPMRDCNDCQDVFPC